MDKSGYKRPASLTSPAIPEDTAAPPPPPLPATDFSKPRLDSYLVVSLNDVSGDDSVRKERREKEREERKIFFTLSPSLPLYVQSNPRRASFGKDKKKLSVPAAAPSVIVSTCTQYVYYLYYLLF